MSVASIVILRWGSLLWDRDDLPRVGDWHQTGLLRPLEFSRVSRNGRLALVLDPDHGVECDTWYVLGPRADIAVTVEDLRLREGTRSSKSIGYIAVDAARENGRLPDLTSRIRSWGLHEASGASFGQTFRAVLESRRGNPSLSPQLPPISVIWNTSPCRRLASTLPRRR